MREKTGGFFAEFRKFIARGNVMDMAVGVIIGGACPPMTTDFNFVDKLKSGDTAHFSALIRPNFPPR